MFYAINVKLYTRFVLTSQMPSFLYFLHSPVTDSVKAGASALSTVCNVICTLTQIAPFHIFCLLCLDLPNNNPLQNPGRKNSLRIQPSVLKPPGLCFKSGSFVPCWHAGDRDHRTSTLIMYQHLSNTSASIQLAVVPLCFITSDT